MKILVTGGAGFIGSHLCPMLAARGHVVRVMDNLSPQIHGDVPDGLGWLTDGPYDFQRGSVTSRADLEKALEGMDAVVHLAAETGTGQSMYEIERYNDVNTLGTALLLDILTNMEERTVSRMALASSRSVYGEGAYLCATCGPEKRYFPTSRSAEALKSENWEYDCPTCGGELVATATRETDQILPASIYAATKYAQEDLVRISCSSLGLGYAILRLQNVYGEGQSLNNPYTGILSIFSTRIRRGLQLPIFEDGLETRDFVHVEDVARAFMAAIELEQGPDDIINVGSGVKTSVADIATQLSRAFGATPNIKVTGQFRLGDIRHNCADVSKLKSLLGLEPGISLADGLGRFASWVKTQPLPEDQLDKANQELQTRNLMGTSG